MSDSPATALCDAQRQRLDELTVRYRGTVYAIAEPGEPGCPARSAEGYECSRAAGHASNHCAWGSCGPIVVWPQCGLNNEDEAST